MLLHGITASSLSFGAEWDDLPGHVVAIDLLGFGRSMDAPTPAYTAAAHIDAVLATLDNAGLADRPTVFVGHSMGGVLALHLGAAHAATLGVVALSAPLYDTEEEAMAGIVHADPLARLITVGPVAKRVCEFMCANRRASRILAPLLAWRWPAPVARDGVRHTWTSYRTSLQSLVIDSRYRQPLAALANSEVPVLLLNGTDDGVPVSGRAESVAATHYRWEARLIQDAGHALPLSHPEQCTRLVAPAVANWAG